MRTRILYTMIFAVSLLASCKEQQIERYDVSQSTLNIAKGVFRPNEYPESYSFNAYFLGVGAGDYTLKIPVRLSGEIDYNNDREYKVGVNAEKSQNVANGEEFTLNPTQILRKGMYEDSITVTIHVSKLNETDNYKLCVELVPTQTFGVGIPRYQFVEIAFMKNVNVPPPFWENTSKLSRLTYHPMKCAKFLEFSGITDPEWEDAGSSFALDHWIALCVKWFEDNEVFDDEDQRIYFDE